MTAAAHAWALSGAMFLTGRPGGTPLPPPPGFVEGLWAVGHRLAGAAEKVRSHLGVDVLALLGERAAIAGLRRRGDVSCGGAARLLPAADGWLAVNLPRPGDLDLLPAWLPERITHRYGGQSAPAPATGTGPDPETWAAIAEAVAAAPAGTLAERAQLLGLAVAPLPRARRAPHPFPTPPPADAVPSPCAAAATPATRFPSAPAAAFPSAGAFPSPGGPPAGLPVAGTAFGDTAPVAALRGRLVVDLSSLWAGPLCTHLLQLAGARVVKLESRQRPDGARNGPTAFFDLLHGGQESVALDFSDEDGRAALRTLIAAADVVVEASRPRALEQLGVFAEEVLRSGGTGTDPRAAGGASSADPRRTGGSDAGPKVWLSITGYGRQGPGRNAIAFGDDAAVAGGLVARDESGPCFLADAVADPCAGIVGAAAVLEALAAGGRWLLDVSLQGVAAHLAGSDPGGTAVDRRDDPPDGLAAEPPRARSASSRAPRLGEHTEQVLAELRSR